MSQFQLFWLFLLKIYLNPRIYKFLWKQIHIIIDFLALILLLFYNWILLSVFNRCFTLCYSCVFIDYISDLSQALTRYHVLPLLNSTAAKVIRLSINTTLASQLHIPTKAKSHHLFHKKIQNHVQTQFRCYNLYKIQCLYRTVRYKQKGGGVVNFPKFLQ